MSSSRPEDLPLLPLGCPSCGGGLDPLRDDLLFLCAACGGASELVGTATVRRELRHKTPGTGPPPVHLPFWRLSGSSLVPAFNGSRLLTLARWYTERMALLDAHPGGPAPRGLWGGRIGAGDAPRLAALASGNTLAAQGTRGAGAGAGTAASRDAGAVAVEAGGAAPALFAVPFHREPSRLVCAITGLHLYLETLEGSAELMARWKKVLDGS